MDIKDTFIAANSALTDLVLRVRPEHLALEAPPYARFHDGQTLRDSLNIMAYENQCVPKVLAGESGLTTNPEFDGDLLGDDLAGNYERLASEANASVRAHADLDRTVHMSYADVPARGYLSDISLNRTMALYDAAALTGLEPHLPDEAIREIHAIATQNGPAPPKDGDLPARDRRLQRRRPGGPLPRLHRPTTQGQVRARGVIRSARRAMAAATRADAAASWPAASIDRGRLARPATAAGRDPVRG